MCGRVAIKYDADWLRRRYGTINPVVNFPRNYNGAPTDQLPVVRLAKDGKRHLDLLRWGLVPPFAKDIRFGVKCINARAERWRRSRRSATPIASAAASYP